MNEPISPQPSTPALTYKLATTLDEFEQSFSLVYKEYVKKGYIPPHYRSTLRLSLFNALPTTTTFVCKRDAQVLATVTLVADSPLGIPMDKIYKQEVDTLRQKGKHVAEASQLSIDTSMYPKGMFSMFNYDKLIFIFKLFRLILQYAIYQDKIDEICIAINPNQNNLYKFIYFEDLGPRKYYGSVNKAPAIAKHLNLHSFLDKLQTRKGLSAIFHGEKPNPSVFAEKRALTADELKYLFVEKSNMFETATKAQMEHIRSCYPSVDFDSMFKNGGTLPTV